jgi:hypothetical protein
LIEINPIEVILLMSQSVLVDGLLFFSLLIDFMSYFFKILLLIVFLFVFGPLLFLWSELLKVIGILLVLLGAVES